jgi:hypothetical protein
MVSQLDQDKDFMNQQISDLKIESGALRQQLELEQMKYRDLEMVIQNERQNVHSSQFEAGDLGRKN